MAEILISSSVLIAVIALLRAILQDRIRPGLQYALWGLVLLRLLIPINWFESPVSVAKAAEPIVRQVQQFSAENTRTVTIPVTMGENPETGEPIEALARDSIAPLDIARWVWLGGAVMLAGWFLFVNIRLAAKLSRDRKLYSGAYKVPVYITDAIPSPCLYLGDIYLTEEAASDPLRAEYIIAHELTHRRHLDGLWSVLRVVCLAVYWFNPLVWLAAVLSRRDCELFCDAATVRRLGEERRFDYGRTLLDLTAVNVRPRDLICSATTMSGSGRSLKERIARIAEKRKASFLLCAAAILIAAVAVGCTFSGSETEMYFEESPVFAEPDPTPAPEPTDEASDPFYGLSGVKPLPDESPLPVLETSDFGILGVFWTGHENAMLEGHLLTEYLTGCTMTPIYYFEEYTDLHNADAEIRITVDSLNIFLGVPGADIPHYAILLEPDAYIVCALNDGDRIYEDVKALLSQSESVSASPIPDRGTPPAWEEDAPVPAEKAADEPVAAGERDAAATPTPAPLPMITELIITYQEHEMLDFTEQVGGEVQLDAYIYPAEAEAEVFWSSSNESVATVREDGLVTITGPGICTVSVIAGDMRAECVVRGYEE